MIRAILCVLALYLALGFVRNMQWEAAERADTVTWAGFSVQKKYMQDVVNLCPKAEDVARDYNLLYSGSFKEKYGEACYRAITQMNFNRPKYFVSPSWNQKIFLSYDPDKPAGYDIDDII